MKIWLGHWTGVGKRVSGGLIFAKAMPFWSQIKRGCDNFKESVHVELGAVIITVRQSCRAALISPPTRIEMPSAMLSKKGLRVFWRKFGLNGNFALLQWFGRSVPSGLYHAHF